MFLLELGVLETLKAFTPRVLAQVRRCLLQEKDAT